MPPQDDDYTFGQLVENALNAFHNGEDLTDFYEAFDVLQYAPHNRLSTAGVADEAASIIKQFQSAEARKDGTYAAAKEELFRADHDRDPKRHYADPETFERDFRAGEIRYERAKAAFASIDYGDGFMHTGIFGGVTKRRRVVNKKGFFGVADDGFFMESTMSDRVVKDLMVNEDGSQMFQPAFRRQVMRAETARHPDTGDLFLSTDIGPISIQREIDAWSRPEVKDNIRRALGGLTGREQNVGPLELAPGTLQSWAAREIAELIAGEDFEGKLYNVNTAAPEIKFPELPNLYPGRGSMGAADSYDALQDPVKLRAFLEVVADMEDAGELGLTTGEHGFVMLGHLVDFAGVQAGWVHGIRTIGKLSAKAGVAPGVRATFLGRGAKRLGSVIAAENTHARALRPWGMVFDKRNIGEEILYAMTRNAITGEGSWKQGFAEGLTEGIAEGALHAGWRGTLKGVGWAAGSMSSLAQRSRLGALVPQPVMHPIQWAHATNARADLFLRHRLETGGRVRGGVLRGLQRYRQTGLALDVAAQTSDAIFVGGMFGAYGSAYNDYADEWGAMSWTAKTAAIFRALDSPEALGNMIAYATVSGMYGAASLTGNRLKNIRKKEPELYEQMQRTAASVVHGHLSTGNLETFEAFTKSFEQLRKDNPDILPKEHIRTPIERTSAADMGEAFDRLDKQEGVKTGTNRTMLGWEPHRAQSGRKGVDWSPVDSDEAAFLAFRYWRRKDNPYAVRRLDLPAPVYVVVDAENPKHIIGDTSVWQTPANAAAQADAVWTEQQLRETGEHAGQQLIKADILPKGFNLPEGTWKFDTSLLLAGKAPDVREIRPDQVARLLHDEMGFDKETVGNIIEGVKNQEAWAIELVTRMVTEPTVGPTPEEAVATLEAHETDPEHVGKHPAEIVEDVRKAKRRATPREKEPRQADPDVVTEFHVEQSGYETLEEARAHEEATRPPDPINPGAAKARSEEVAVEGIPGDVRLAQAGVAGSRGAHLIGLAFPGSFPEGADPSDPRVMATMVWIANMPDELVLPSVLAETEGMGDSERLALATELHKVSKDWMSYHQGATLELAQETGNADLVSAVETFWNNPDDLTGHERQELDRWYRAVMAEKYGLADDQIKSAFYSLAPWAIFGGALDRGDIAGNEFIVSRWTRFRKWIEWAGNRFQKKTDKPITRPVGGLARAQNLYQRGLGRFASGVSLAADAAEQNAKMLDVVSTRMAQKQEWGAMMSQVLRDMNAPYGPSGLDQAGRDLVYEAIDSGIMHRVRDEADWVRRFGEDRRHLFGIAQRIVEINNSMGQEMVNLGWMTEEQFAQHQGKWVMHEYVRVNHQTLYDLASKKDYYGMLAGRNLSRTETGQHDQALRIMHPHIFQMGVQHESKAVQFFGVMHDIVEQGMALTLSDVQQMAPWERGQYETITGDGRPGFDDKDDVNGRAYNSRQIKAFAVWKTIRENMQTRNEHELGARERTLKDGRVIKLRPWTEGMENLVDTVLGVKDGETGEWIKEPAVVTAGIAQQLQVIVNNTFLAQNPDSKLQTASRWVNDTMLHWRQKKTIFNTTHWTLARVSDVFTNHISDVVSLWDFISSMTVGRGSWFDGMQGINQLHEWQQLGMPMTKPEGWTDAKWETVEEAREVSDLLFGSTFTTQLIKSGTLGDFFASSFEPEDFVKDMDAQMARQPISDDLQVELHRAVVKMSNSFMPSKLKRDEKRLASWGVRQPGRRAQAVMDWVNEYQAFEFWSKYSAYLNLKKRNPEMSRQALVRWAAKGTADYRDTSIALQQFSTNFNIFDESRPLPAIAKLAAPLFASPFLLYPQAMAPHMLRSGVAHPLRVGSAAALAATVAATIIGSLSDDEKIEHFRSRAGSRETPGMPYVTKEEAQMIATAMGDKMAMAWPGGGSHLSAAMGRKFWHVVLMGLQMAPYEFQVGGRRQLQRRSDVSDLVGGARVQKAVATVRDWNALTNADRAKRTFESMEGILWHAARGFASGVFGVKTRLQRGDPEGAAREAILGSVALGREFSGNLDPGPTAFFSRQGIHAIEALLLGQQSIRDFLHNQIPVTTDSAEKALGELIFSTMWRSQDVRPYESFGEEGSFTEHFVEKLFPDIDPISPERDRARRATRLVMEQVTEIVTGEYHKYRTEVKVPVEMRRGLILSGRDDSLTGRIGLAMDLGNDLVPGTMELKPKDELMSVIGKRIARESDADVQAMAILAARRLILSDGWTGPVHDLLMEAAEQRNLTPGELRVMYRASLQDDRGHGLIKQFHQSLLEDGDHGLAGPIYRIWSTIPRPNEEESHAAFKDWTELREYFQPVQRGIPGKAEGILEALPTGPFGVGKDIKPARKSREAVRLFQKDLQEQR